MIRSVYLEHECHVPLRLKLRRMASGSVQLRVSLQIDSTNRPLLPSVSQSRKVMLAVDDFSPKDVDAIFRAMERSVHQTCCPADRRLCVCVGLRQVREDVSGAIRVRKSEQS